MSRLRPFSHDELLIAGCAGLLAAISLVLAGLATAADPAAPGKPARPALREVCHGKFDIGASLEGRVPDDYRPEELDLLSAQFDCVTPANCMKLEHIARRPGKLDFAEADGLVEFATARRLKVCGHCLVWARDEATPGWFCQGPEGKPLAGEQLLQRMRGHIAAVVGRYRGKLASWDVINEALGDGDDELRPSKWLSIAGRSFIAEAFIAARAADPQALLIYNDYSIEQPRKRAKLLRLLDDLKARHAPVDGVGIQGHWEIDRSPLKDLEETLIALRDRHLKVMITELDLDVTDRSRWWANGGRQRAELAKEDRFRDGCPAEILGRQAEQYAALFRLLRKYSGTVVRVTFWNLHDGRSWLNGFPWKHTNYPLLFDRQCQPKPAFWAVVRERN